MVVNLWKRPLSTCPATASRSASENATLTVFEDAGELIELEQPERFFAEVSTFIGQAGERGGQ
jgi:hypothetical protein